MTWLLMLALASATLTWGSTVPGFRALDREALLAALEQRAATGVPRHLTHDEGEELQAAVTAALIAQPNDGELAWAATRASFAVIPHVGPAVYDASPSIALEVLSPLSLPWTLAISGTIDMSVDGAAWRHAADIAPGPAAIHIPLEKIFPKAGQAGFHVVRLRALLRFRGQPGAPASETRALPARTYGVTGKSAAGQRVTAFLNSAANANASNFDSTLPAMALDTWLRTVITGDAPPPIWTGHWCEDRPGVGEQAPASLCARTMIGSAPDGGHAELWVKVATVDTSGDRPTWTAVTPTLEGVDIIAYPRRSTVSLLRDLPFVLRSPRDAWPRAALSLDANAITLTPANPQPGETVAIRTELRNSGSADVYGMTVDVLAFDTKDRMPRFHRRFVRSIPTGQSLVIDTTATFPLGFGGVVVSLMPLTDDTEFTPLLGDDSNGFSAAARLVRPDLAPPGYADLVRATVGCKPGCTTVR